MEKAYLPSLNYHDIVIGENHFRPFTPVNQKIICYAHTMEPTPCAQRSLSYTIKQDCVDVHGVGLCLPIRIQSSTRFQNVTFSRISLVKEIANVVPQIRSLLFICCANCLGRRQSMIGLEQSRGRSLRCRSDRKRRHYGDQTIKIDESIE